MGEIEATAAVILTVVSAIVTLITGIGTLLSTRASNRSTERRDNIDEVRARREEQFVGVEAAERIGNISLSLAQSLQAQLADCTTKKEDIEKQLDLLHEENMDLRLKVKRAIRETREILQEHDDLHGDLPTPCPGFEIVQKSLTKLLEDLEVTVS